VPNVRFRGKSCPESVPIQTSCQMQNSAVDDASSLALLRVAVVGVVYRVVCSSVALNQKSNQEQMPEQLSRVPSVLGR